MTFAEKLKEIRQKQNMSIKELSEKSGLTTTIIISYEKDRCVPGPVSISKLASALNYDYNELYDLIQKQQNN